MITIDLDRPSQCLFDVAVRMASSILWMLGTLLKVNTHDHTAQTEHHVVHYAKPSAGIYCLQITRA